MTQTPADPPVPHVAGQRALVAIPVCRHPDGFEHPAPLILIGGNTYDGTCDTGGAVLRWLITDADDEPDGLAGDAG